MWPRLRAAWDHTSAPPNPPPVSTALPSLFVHSQAMDTEYPPLPRRIKTARLLLRPFAPDDVDDVLAYAGDSQWARYLAFIPQPFARPQAESFVAQRILFDWKLRPTWAITRDHRVIGGLGLQLEANDKSATINYGIARTHWGQGLATEAAQAVVDSAFDTWPTLNRIESFTDARNTASLRVMAKLGMQREATLRQSRLRRGELVDWAGCGLLRRDWERRHDE